MTHSNETTLTPIPFNSTRSDLDISLELSFRPSISLSASLGLDVPKLDVEIKQVHNVTSSCAPAPPSLHPDQVYENLTLVVPSLGFGVLEVLQEGATFPDVHLSAQQPFNQTFERNLTTACLFFDAAKKGLAPAPVTRPAHLSLAAGVRVPLGVALVAAGVTGLVLM